MKLRTWVVLGCLLSCASVSTAQVNMTWKQLGTTLPTVMRCAYFFDTTHGVVAGVGAIWSVIGGGRYNYDGPGGEYNIVGGGSSNTAAQEYSTIGGGHANSISQYLLGWDAEGSTIGGGDTNSIYAYCTDGFIGGGRDNAIVGGIIDEFFHFPPTPFAAIGGGYFDTIYSGDTSSFIGGGDHNVIDTLSPYSAIGGGKQNWIEPHNGSYATIPGGDSLTANSFAQTVVGYNNIRSGTFTYGTAHAGSVIPLFIVGNGDNAAHPSDAFTASYGGFATAFGPAVNPTITGTIYQDNTLIAWGNVHAPVGTLTSGIGCAVTGVAGVYTVTLNVNDPNGGAHTFHAGEGAIVATPTKTTAGGMALITITPITAAGTFTVTTWDVAAGAAAATIDFEFHVVAQ